MFNHLHFSSILFVSLTHSVSPKLTIQFDNMTINLTPDRRDNVSTCPKYSTIRIETTLLFFRCFDVKSSQFTSYIQVYTRKKFSDRYHNTHKFSYECNLLTRIITNDPSTEPIVRFELFFFVVIAECQLIYKAILSCLFFFGRAYTRESVYYILP